MSSPVVESGETAANSPARLDYIDWLRVITTLCVFVFHSARFFDSFSDWHVRNATTWIGGDIIVGFMSRWIMPMFMVLAGASTCLSLQSRAPGQYLKERVLRLLVPFLFGVLVIIVPQQYYELLFRGTVPCDNLFYCYYLYILDLPNRFAGFSFFHLWFLIVLFVFSVFCLPLFLRLLKSGQSVLSAFSARINSGWALMLLLVLPLFIVDWLVYPGTFAGSREGFGGWSLCAHFLFFISGYIIFSNPRVSDLLKGLGWPVAIGAVLAAAGFIPLIGTLVNWKNSYGTPLYALAQLLDSLLTWCLLLLFINLGRLFLNFRNGFLSYASEAVLPFYILHQTVIIVVGYYVVQLNIDPALKYLIILIIAFSLIMAVYDVLVKRFNTLRFLFGMRLKKKVIK